MRTAPVAVFFITAVYLSAVTASNGVTCSFLTDPVDETVRILIHFDDDIRTAGTVYTLKTQEAGSPVQILVFGWDGSNTKLFKTDPNSDYLVPESIGLSSDFMYVFATMVKPEINWKYSYQVQKVQGDLHTCRFTYSGERDSSKATTTVKSAGIADSGDSKEKTTIIVLAVLFALAVIGCVIGFVFMVLYCRKTKGTRQEKTSPLSQSTIEQGKKVVQELKETTNVWNERSSNGSNFGNGKEAFMANPEESRHETGPDLSDCTSQAAQQDSSNDPPQEEERRTPGTKPSPPPRQRPKDMKIPRQVGSEPVVATINADETTAYAEYEYGNASENEEDGNDDTNEEAPLVKAPSTEEPSQQTGKQTDTDSGRDTQVKRMALELEKQNLFSNKTKDN